MIDLILAAALLQTPDPCHAVPTPPSATCPAWQSLFRSDRGEVFMDPGSARRDGDTVEATMRVVFARDSDGVRSVINRHRYDCRARTVTELLGALYDVRGAKLDERVPTGEAAATVAVPAGSPHATAMNALCPR